MKIKVITKFAILIIILGFFIFFGTEKSFAAQEINLDAFYLSGPFKGQTIGDTQLEPLSRVALEATLLDPRGMGICDGTGTILRNTMAHAIGGDLKNIEYLEKGQRTFIDFEFETGTSGRKNVYWPIFYCSNVDDPKKAVSAVNFDGSKIKFDHETVGAGTCNVSNARWGASSGEIGKSLDLKVDGTIGCKGKEITFKIFKPGYFTPEQTIKGIFPAAYTTMEGGMPVFLGTGKWTPNKTGKFLFDAEVPGTESTGKFKARSSEISITEFGGGGNGGSTTTTTTTVTGEETFLPPFGIQGFTDLFDKIITWLMRIAIPIGVIMIVISGVLMVISQGTPQKVTQAKTIFRYAIIGLAIVLIGKGFITLLESIINIGK